MPVCYKTGCKRLLTRVRLQWSPPIWFPYCRSTLRPPTWGRVSTLGSWWPGWGLHLSGLIGSLEKCCGTSLVLQPQTVRVSFPLSVCLVLFFFFFLGGGAFFPKMWQGSQACTERERLSIILVFASGNKMFTDRHLTFRNLLYLLQFPLLYP